MLLQQITWWRVHSKKWAASEAMPIIGSKFLQIFLAICNIILMWLIVSFIFFENLLHTNWRLCLTRSMTMIHALINVDDNQIVFSHLWLWQNSIYMQLKLKSNTNTNKIRISLFITSAYSSLDPIDTQMLYLEQPVEWCLSQSFLVCIFSKLASPGPAILKPFLLCSLNILHLP